MRKEDMILRILRRIECDFFKVNPVELDRTLKLEWLLLNEKTYTEVEELYYATV